MEQQMYKVQIDGEERSFPAGNTYLQIAGEYQERYPHDIVLVYSAPSCVYFPAFTKAL